MLRDPDACAGRRGGLWYSKGQLSSFCRSTKRCVCLSNERLRV
jgi:hypothetical protein